MACYPSFPESQPPGELSAHPHCCPSPWQWGWRVKANRVALTWMPTWRTGPVFSSSSHACSLSASGPALCTVPKNKYGT